MLFRMFVYLTPRLIRSLHPKFDPATIAPPARAMQILDQAEAKWGRGAAAR